MAIFNVASNAQLNSALAAAKGGDTILIAGGDYGPLKMNTTVKPHYAFDAEMTIASMDPDAPAVFSELLMRGVENLTLDSLTFDFVTDASTPASSVPFKVDELSGITIRNATFDGDVFKGGAATENGYPTGFGLMVVRSEDIAIENSEFFSFREAAIFSTVDNLAVRNNVFHGMSGDATKFATITTGLIEGNIIRDFNSNPDNGFHRDMIQFLTYGNTTPSSDIVIRGNILHSGENGWSQSIFMGNEAVNIQGAGPEMYYQNVLIEDNVVYNSHNHGISVSDTNGLVIKNNTVLQNPAEGDPQSVYIPAINVASSSQNVAITKNIAHIVPASVKAGWNVSDNLIVQRIDPLGANHYDDLFVAANQPAAPIEALQALPGGLIQTLAVGAAMTRIRCQSRCAYRPCQPCGPTGRACLRRGLHGRTGRSCRRRGAL